MGGAEDLQILQALQRVETAIANNSGDIQSLLLAVSKNTHAINNQVMTINGAVRNVMEKQNGIVPLEMMRISEHKEILTSTIESHAKQVTGIQESNAKQQKAMLWAFGLILGVVLGGKSIGQGVGEAMHSLAEVIGE